MVSEEAQEVGLDPESEAGAAALFDSLLDAMEAQATDPTAAPGTEAAAPAAAGGGLSASLPEGVEPAPAPAAAPAAGNAGEPGVPGAAAAAPVTAAPVDATADGGDTLDAETLKPKWGEISTALEERNAKGHQMEAMAAVKEEYGRYFETLEKHPRQIIGTKVPALGNEPDADADGFITLRDTEDAKDWQEAARALLVQEIRNRTAQTIEEDRETLNVLHKSIELFQNNVDLIPKTKQFDRELADRFVAIAKDYEIRVDGKLHGYAIDVQPLINQLRGILATERSAKAAAPPAPTASSTPAAPAAAVGQIPAAAPAGPQAGIQAKAGAAADDSEDFSGIWATLGLPNIQV